MFQDVHEMSRCAFIQLCEVAQCGLLSMLEIAVKPIGPVTSRGSLWLVKRNVHFPLQRLAPSPLGDRAMPNRRRARFIKGSGELVSIRQGNGCRKTPLPVEKDGVGRRCRICSVKTDGLSTRCRAPTHTHSSHLSAAVIKHAH